MPYTADQVRQLVPFFIERANGITTEDDGIHIWLRDDDPAATETVNNNDIWFETDSNEIKVREAGAWTTYAGTGSTPALAEYVCMALSAGLTNERVLTAGDGLDLTDGGANGNATLDVDVTDFIDTSYGLTESTNNIRIDLASPSGLSFSAGNLQIDDSVAGSGLNIASKILSVNEPALGLDAQFVVMAAEADLDNERVLTAGDGLDLTDGGAGGNVTLAVDVTDILGSGLTESANNIDLNWGTPTISTIQCDDSASAGTSTNPTRSDHKHAIICATAGNITPDASAAEGSATSFARSDHTHGITCAAPSANLSVSTTNAEGSASSFSRSDHSHAITSSSNPGAAASLLATDTSGYLQLKGLGVGSAATEDDGILVVGHSVFGNATPFSPALAVDITETLTGLTAFESAEKISLNVTLNANSAFSARGISLSATLDNAGYTANSVQGLNIIASADGAGTTEEAYGIASFAKNLGAGTVGLAIGLYAGAIGNHGGGTITTGYGLCVASQTAATTNYAIWTSTGTVRFGDNVVLADGKYIGCDATSPKIVFDDTSDELELTVTGGQILLAGSGNFTIAPAGDVLFDPAGNDILPVTGYDLNIGSLSKKYLTLHAAELWVETLVAQDTLATIGGRILVGPTTMLTSDLAPAATTIYVEHNNLANGDRVYCEANGNVEFMSIDSAPGGAGPYTYTVTRDLDGSGANQWYAGDAVFNTGATGDGFIDLYSISGIKSGSGPTIVGNIRNSATYNDWTEHWAIGNLNGIYGYGVDTHGVAFGKYSAADYITIDASSGIRFLDSGDVVRGQLTSAVWTLGSTGSEHIRISATAFQIKDGATVYTDLTAGVLTLGDISNEYVKVSSSGTQIYDGATLYATYGATTTIGLTASEHISISATAVQLKDGATTYTDLTAGVLTLGDSSNEHIIVNTSGVQLKDGATTYGVFAATTTIGVTTTEHISITSTTLQFKDGATVYSELTGGTLTLGDTSNEHVKVSTSGTQIYDGATLYATYGATTTIGLTASEHVSISSTSVQFKDGSTVYTDLTAGALSLGDTASENVLINTSGVQLRDGSTVYGAFAATTTIGVTTADHVSISSSGIEMKDGAVVRGQWQTDGDIFIGSNISSPDDTYFSIFATAQTYNTESVSAGDMLIGDNSASKANIFWDKSAGKMQFRGGTTMQVEVSTDGSLIAGAGDVVLDSDGITIAVGTSYLSRDAVKFEKGANIIGELFGYEDGSLRATCLYARDTNSVVPVDLLLAAYAPYQETAVAKLEANSDSGWATYLTITSTDTVSKSVFTGKFVNVGGALCIGSEAGNTDLDTGDAVFGGGLYVGGTGTDPDADDIHYDGNLKSMKNATFYDVYGFVPLEDAVVIWTTESNKASQTIDLQSAPYSLPANIKAVSARLSYYAASDGDWGALRRDSGDRNAIRARCPDANEYDDAAGIVVCDANGDIYFATNNDTNTVWLIINGYFI